MSFGSREESLSTLFWPGKLLGTALKSPSMPKITPITATKMTPGVESMEWDLRQQLKKAGSRRKSMLTPLGLLNVKAPLRTSVLSDILG